MKKLILIVLAILLATSTAYAQNAEELHQRGQESYDRGRYDDAIVAWSRALELSPDAVGLYYNLGQAYRLAGRCVDALGAYRKFVELDPKSAKRELAQGFIVELTPKCGEKSKTATAKPKVKIKPDVTVRTTKSRGRTKRVVGISIAGSGAALFLGGLYFGSRANALGDDVAAACADGCVWQDVQADHERGQRYETIQWVLVGTGAATIVTGGVLYYLGKREAYEPSVRVTPGAGGALISWGGSW